MIPIRNTEGEVLNYMQVSEDLLSKTDGLTHFPTRPMFIYYYDALNRSHPEKSVYLMIIDVDDFKTINDTYGHGVGDEIIRITGRKLTSILGQEDYICRFGGDEFLILFVDQTMEDVLEKGRYILSTIYDFPKTEKDPLKITYSIGIASREKGDGYQELLEKADSALYQVKENGKGGIRIFGWNSLDEKVV